jgi:LacI family transcriptional regulator
MVKDTNNKSATTIYDIARHLNISPSTVSKALSNKTVITAETRKKVQNTAKLLYYIPNVAARYLKTQKTNQIMIEMPYVADEFINWCFIWHANNRGSF